MVCPAFRVTVKECKPRHMTKVVEGLCVCTPTCTQVCINAFFMMWLKNWKERVLWTWEIIEFFMEEVEHESTMEILNKWKGTMRNISPGEKDEDMPQSMQSPGIYRWQLRNPAYIKKKRVNIFWWGKALNIRIKGGILNTQSKSSLWFDTLFKAVEPVFSFLI